MNQQDAYLSCSKQEIYTKHQSEVIVLHDCRQLLNKASPCEILKDITGRRQGD